MENEIEEIVKQFLKLVSGRLDEHTTEKGVIESKGGKVILFTPDHIQFAKYGRAPGKLPPIAPLIDWVKAKGIARNDDEARGTAFAIAKSIAKNGTKNYVKNAPNAIGEAIEDEFDNYTTRLSGYFSDKINEEILDLVVEALPKDWTTKTSTQ